MGHFERILSQPTDMSRKDYRQNKNLPKPKNKVIGPVFALPLSNALGIQMQVTHSDPNQHVRWISIDNQKFFFGGDVSYVYKDLEIKDYTPNDYYIGDAIIPNTHPIHKTFPAVHLQSPWNDSVWMQPMPETKMPSLSIRQGWCCTMGNSRPHRDLVVDHIPELLSLGPYYFVYDYPAQQHDYLKKYMFRNIPRQKIKEDGWQDGDLQVWHHKCLLEICAETNDDIFYPSEKTWKPIAAQQLFVVIACKHYLRRLRHMGFKTFHPFIDESYDDIDNMDTRVSTAMRSVKSFLTKKINKTSIQALQSIVDHNKKRLQYLQQFDYMKHVAKKLKKYIKF